MVRVPGQPQEQTAASERPWQKAMTEESSGVREGGSGQKAENWEGGAGMALPGPAIPWQRPRKKILGLVLQSTTLELSSL